VRIRTRLFLWFGGVMSAALLAMGLLSYWEFVVEPRRAQLRPAGPKTEEAEENTLADLGELLLWCGLPALALALGGRPELLVLDDPTLGLDAVARREVYDELLGELAERGTTVFITTHDLAGIEGLADRVGILHLGRLLVDASLEDLKARYRKIGWAPAQALRLEDLAPYGPLGFRAGSLGGEAVLQGDPAPLLAARPEVQLQDLSLEELFVTLVGADTEVAS